MKKVAPKNEVERLLHHVIANMATKDEMQELSDKVDRTASKEDLAQLEAKMETRFSELEDSIAGIHTEIKDIKERLKVISADVENTKQYSKEIDYALLRIANIEKHLGIVAPKMA